MKKIMFALGLMFTALTLTNCSQEIDETIIPDDSQKNFAVFADVPETRTTIDGFTTEWKAGDALTLFYNNTYAGSFTNSAENVYKFEGTEPTLDDATSYTWYAIYPASTFNSSKTPSETAYDNVGYKDYTQDGYDNTSHVCGDYAPLWGKVVKEAGDYNVHFNMHHLCSMLAIKVTNTTGEDIIVNSASFASDKQDFVGTYHLNLTGEKVAYKSSGANYVYKAATVTVKNAGQLADGETAILYMPIKPFANVAGETFTLTVNTSNGSTIKTLTMDAANTVEFKAGIIKPLTVSIEKNETPGATLPLIEDFSWVKANAGENAEATAPAGYVYTKIYNAATAGEVKYGTGSAKGQIILPALNLSTNYTVIITAKKYSSDSAKLTISTNGTAIGTITLDSTYKPYHIYGDAVSANATITIAATNASNCRGYITEIKVLEGTVLPVAEINAITSGATSYANTADGTTATLNGAYTTANLSGDETIAVGFDYKLTSATTYTTVTATVANSFKYDLTGLINGEEYTYRAWASLDGGNTKVYGNTATFTPTKVSAEVTVFSKDITIKGSTGSLASDKNSISWTSGDVTVTNIKGGTAIRNSDTDHYRVYQGSKFNISVEGGTISQVVITCASSSYATVMQTSFKNAGYTATVSGSVVTVTGNAATFSMTASAQTRLNKVSVTYTK